MEWYRGDDAGDLKRSELNELVENWTCLNAFEEKIWKSDQKDVMNDEINPTILMDEKSWNPWESNKKIVMDEELVQNIVTVEKIVKNFVTDAKIDPKVVMDLSIFKIGGWNILQPINRKLLEECIDEN